MTDEAVDSVQDELLKAIKESLDALNKDSNNKDIIHKDTAKTLKLVQGCVSEIKLSVAKIKTEQTGFILAHRDRTLNCDKIHSDVEQRLRDHPAPIRCKTNEARLKVVEVKVDAFQPFMYKVIGAVIAIAILVPPALSGVVAFIIKHVSIGKVP